MEQSKIIDTLETYHLPLPPGHKALWVFLQVYQQLRLQFHCGGHHQWSKSAQGFGLEMPESCQHPAPLQGLGQWQKQTKLPSDLASAIIDPYYMKMKNESNKDRNVRHSVWHKRLDEQHVKYTAMDAYTCYEMYRKIVDMRNCLLPDPDKGSSHIVVAGASQEVDD